MRKVTEQIRIAWRAGKSKSVGNTTTDGSSVWLHGNKIIKVEDGEVFATFAGWHTRTTQDRLNGITDGHFHTHKFQPFFNDQRIHDDEWVFVGSK